MATRDLAKDIRERVNRWVQPRIRAMRAYHVPRADNLIKLDAMENPYTWPDGMREQWLRRLRQVDVNRYPDPDAGALKSEIRRTMAVPAGMQLLLGNGSDELIQCIQLCVAGKGRTVLAPTPSFSMYEMTATCIGASFVGVPLTPDFSLDLDAMMSAIDAHNPAVVFIAYPNNPSGNLFATDAIDRIVAGVDGLVVIDEAYHAFANASYYDRLGEFENLVVMRTLSKLGLAGLRLGFIAGPGAWIDEFNKVRLPYNVNVLSQITAEFALQNMDVLQQQARDMIRQRDRLFTALSGFPGLVTFPSAANFILFKTTTIAADTVHQYLFEQGVLVKNLHQPNSPLEQCLRVSVGTEEENTVFLQALQDLGNDQT